MPRTVRRPRVAAALAVAGLLAACAPDPLVAPRAPSGLTPPVATLAPAAAASEVVMRWSEVELAAIRSARPGPPMAARGLAIVHTAMYDAWALYDAVAVPTQLDPALRRPAAERTLAHKRRAVSHAAYRALLDLYPGEAARFTGQMQALGYDPADATTDPASAAGIGNRAAAAVLAVRHADGSNQKGNLAPGAYADWTGYQPVNGPDLVVDATRWQPLRVPDGRGGFTVQRFLAPHWGLVVPFALARGDALRPPPPRALTQWGGQVRQVEDVLHESARLGDREKAIAEYWSDGPASELPPGHWCLLAGWVVERDALGLDDQVKLFFALGNALMDAGITAWDAKRAYDTVRPITAIRTLKAGKPIRAWGGPGLGTVQMPGEGWMPFQAATFVTPPFPEYVSGHSTFSMAAATVLARFTGSDRFGHAVTLGAGSSRLEPGRSPARPVTLAWPTFTAAADEAGLSRRYGGIHFVDGDLAGRALGREVGERVWARARTLWTGGDAGSDVGDGAVALVTR